MEEGGCRLLVVMFCLYHLDDFFSRRTGRGSAGADDGDDDDGGSTIKERVDPPFSRDGLRDEGLEGAGAVASLDLVVVGLA